MEEKDERVSVMIYDCSHRSIQTWPYLHVDKLLIELSLKHLLSKQSAILSFGHSIDILL